MAAPKDAGTMHVSQSQKYLRVIDADTEDVVQLGMVDTGLITADGLSIYALGTATMPGSISDGPNSETSGILVLTGVGTLDPIPVTSDCRSVWIQNDPGNTTDVLVFGVMNLGPGEQMVIPTGEDASWITIEGTAGGENLNYAVLQRT